MGLIDKEMTVENLYIYVTRGKSRLLDQDSTHNTLLGWPFLKEMKVITSIYHIYMKFHTPKRVGCVKGYQYESRECYNRAVKEFDKTRNPKDTLMVDLTKKEGKS